ncbi:type II secretion system protein GspD [Sporomusa aerivorans]|uniref:type II secretion system protein GspD n=1 Tax=Sporomusa aerivorans TaxID=204936 RepID=UPI00352B4265
MACYRWRQLISFVLLTLLLIVLPGFASASPAGLESPGDRPVNPQPVADGEILPAAEPVSQPDSYGQHPLVVQLDYLKVDQAKPLLSAVVPEDQIKTDPLRNTLVIMSSPDVYDQIHYLLTKIDTPPKQVMFEVQVIELNRDDSTNLGVDWGASTKLPSAPVSDDLPYRIGTGKYGVNLQGVVNRLIENKKGRLLASPRVATLDGVTAKILIGDKLAVESSQPTTGSIPIISVVYVDVGIKLEVTPAVNKDGYITTRIQPEVSNKTDTTKNGNPNIRTRQADATLRVKSGVTIVLGGLIQRQETRDTFKVPILGQLPLVGGLFHSTSKQITETELVIMLTPKIIE